MVIMLIKITSNKTKSSYYEEGKLTCHSGQARLYYVVELLLDPQSLFEAGKREGRAGRERGGSGSLHHRDGQHNESHDRPMYTVE